MKLFDEGDGANYQAKAVLAFLQARNVEDSWDESTRQYTLQPCVYRWSNCREQGYVITVRIGYSSPQLNIAFFEHRNSDSICAVEWEQETINPPTIDTMETGGKIYKDKYDVSHTVGPYEFRQMAEWIMERIQRFYKTNKNSARKSA